jgi:taurine dioxygenase
LDLSNALDPTTVDEIQNLLLEKQFLTFPNQHLTPARILEIAKRFGHPEVSPIQVGMPHNPEILRMANRASEPDPLLGDAQTIGSFYAQPSKFVFAYCDDPSVNSDIICNSMTEAWNGLSKPIQDFLEPLTALHSAALVYAPTHENADLYVGRASSQLDYSDSVYQTSEHPIVHTHPDTGLRSLFITQPTPSVSTRSLRKRVAPFWISFGNTVRDRNLDAAPSPTRKPCRFGTTG